MHFSMVWTNQIVEEPKKRGLGPSRKPEYCSDFREGPSPLLFSINVLQDLSHKRKFSCVSSLNQRGGILLSSRGDPPPSPLTPNCQSFVHPFSVKSPFEKKFLKFPLPKNYFLSPNLDQISLHFEPLMLF